MKNMMLFALLVVLAFAGFILETLNRVAQAVLEPAIRKIDLWLDWTLRKLSYTS